MLREIGRSSLSRTKQEFAGKSYDQRQFYGAVKQKILKDAPGGAQFRVAIVYNVGENVPKETIANNFLGIRDNESMFSVELPTFDYVQDPVRNAYAAPMSPTVKYVAVGVGALAAVAIAYWLWRRYRG